MDPRKIKEWLEAVASGALTAEAAYGQLSKLPYVDLGFAKADLHRAIRQGLPEVIYCPGKTARQIATIARQLKQHHDIVLATRAEPDKARQVLGETGEAVYDEQSCTIIWGRLPEPDEDIDPVAVVAAGTADLAVAEESAMVLASAAVPVKRIYDVGVAGIHRLLDNIDALQDLSAAIVVAGMDGALPSVIGGMIGCPIIAVPTSTGYGASFHGLAALLTMLNSCAAGITVVNIDNGFGAASAAIRILSRHRAVEERAAAEAKSNGPGEQGDSEPEKFASG